MKFEKANLMDLPKIVAIYNESIPGRMSTADLNPVTIEERRSWFNQFNEKYPIWTIKKEHIIIGWVSLSPFYGRIAYQHTAEISIYLQKTLQHQGIGQQTLKFVQRQLPQLEINTLLAFIFHHNQPSLNLFKNNDFQIWGLLPDIALMDGITRSLDILGYHYVLK